MTHIEHALVHVVDVDHDVQLFLSSCLAAAGMESRAYAHLGAFLNAQRVEQPGCLVIDAHALAMGGIESLAVPLPRAIRYPIIVTAYQADVAMASTAVKIGAIDFVEKPLRDGEIVTAVCAALEVGRQRSLVASRQAAVLAQFATLSHRERQVMAFVTAGKMNKQVAAYLGLSEITIKWYRGAVMRKMHARSLAELVRMADILGEELAMPLKSAGSPRVRSAAAADRHSGYSLAR